MSYSQLINLFIILGLISYSYEFNSQNNHIRRRTRDADLKPTAEAAVGAAFVDQQTFGGKIREDIQADEEIMKRLIRKIRLGINRLAEAGTTDITSLDEWTQIQSDLRAGINIIINAYQRYNDFHRKSFNSIEDYTNSIIAKYETELSNLDQLSPPTSLDSGMDTNDPTWRTWSYSHPRRMRYARAHEVTIETALDCVSDLTKNTYNYQQNIMGQPTGTVTVRIGSDPSAVQSYNLPCNVVTAYNGFQKCATAVADLTQNHACDANPQCQIKGNYQ